MNNTYFILRHGQTPYQVDKKRMIYPWPEPTPIYLTKEGEKQAEKSAKELKKKGIDLIYSSDVTRVKQTAGIVAKELGLEIIFDIRLRDLDHGIYKGGPHEEFSKNFTDPKERLFKRPPHGESWNDVKERMYGFWKEIDNNHKGKTILIISHQGPLWFLEAAVKGLSDEDILDIKGKGLSTGQFKGLME